jgi:Fic family protein
MDESTSAKKALGTVQRIEPTNLETLTVPIADAVAELSAQSAALGSALHPRTAESLAALVRIMNAYYSNLIEGHNTNPRDIERALAGDFAEDEGRRNLQIEAAAHVRVQAEIDRMAASGEMPEPASRPFIQRLHRDFYLDAPESALRVAGRGERYRMTPGQWRSRADQDVVVGRHQPPSSERIPDFMRYFEQRYSFQGLGMAARLTAMAAAHHRFNYIHPFPDGNGRVSRLMSHAMGHAAGIGAHGLWSVSRGLARGLEDRTEYKRFMDATDAPRESDLDGRGKLSEQALREFVLWFLRICIDQVKFMGGLFELNALTGRLRTLAERDERIKPDTAELLVEAAVRGKFERGEAPRITGAPERTARRLLNDAIAAGFLASDTPKGPVSLRFSHDSSDVLFPRLFAAA